jgi:glucosylceramidase
MLAANFILPQGASMANHSRRNFLTTAGAATAALSISRRTGIWAQPASAVRMWSTFGAQRHAKAEAPAWTAAAHPAASTIVVDAGAVKQEILGFGAAITDSSCYVLRQMKDDERQAVMHDLFAPGEMAMNVCRTCVGSSDYARNEYSFDESDQPDPEMKKFSIDHDKEYILPVLREARKLNPELFLFSSPWSPPGWMKPNKSMIGGAMRKTSFGPYALYFRKFLEGYKTEGVLIDAVTVQNETDAEQEGNMPACLWAQEQEMEFAAKFLAPELRKAGLPTKIWVLDHNYSLWGRALDELSDPTVYEAVDGIAWHGYVGDPSAMTRCTTPSRRRMRTGRKAGRTSASRITRPTGPTGPAPSMASSTTGLVPLPRGTSRWTKKASPTSARSPAAALSRLRMAHTRSPAAASITHSRITHGT